MSDTKGFIDHLPDRLAADYAKNKGSFDSGNDADMDTAAGNMVENLKSMWSDLVETGYPNHSFSPSPKKWIENWSNVQLELAGVLAEPNGPGTGGTIVGQVAPGYVIDDLQYLIAKTVEPLLPDGEDGNKVYEPWLSRWKAAQPS